MHHIKRILAIVLITLVFIGCGKTNRKKVLLKLNYEKGNRIDINYQTYITGKNDEKLKDESVKMMFKVDSIISDTAYLLSAKFIRVRVNNKGMLMDESYSSNKRVEDMTEAEKKMHEQFKPVLDSTYKLTISKNGRLIKPFSFAGGLPIAQAFAPIDIETCQIVFPKDSIAIGDEWKHSRSVPLNGAVRNSTYKVISEKDGKIQISEAGELNIPGDGPAKIFTGIYFIDQETKGLISANIEIQAGPGFKAGINIEAH